MTLNQHLEHLKWLMHEFPDAWRAYCWHRAKELSKQPELSSLPQLLAEAMRAKGKNTNSRDGQ